MDRTRPLRSPATRRVLRPVPRDPRRTASDPPSLRTAAPPRAAKRSYPPRVHLGQRPYCQPPGDSAPRPACARAPHSFPRSVWDRSARYARSRGCEVGFWCPPVTPARSATVGGRRLPSTSCCPARSCSPTHYAAGRTGPSPTLPPSPRASRRSHSASAATGSRRAARRAGTTPATRPVATPQPKATGTNHAAKATGTWIMPSGVANAATPIAVQ